MKIIGLRIEKYIDKEISGHNCDFEYKDAEFEKHIICGVLEDNRKVEIELSHSEGECGSGWRTASWGNIKVTEVKKFNGYTFIPKEILTIEDIEPNFDGDISNNVFSVDCDGGDNYYPLGGYYVNMELFKETIRNKKLRPVWIFKGKSNSGKSFLASKLNDLDVYETDSNEALPESIVASVIVLGNKHEFSLEDVKSKIFGEVEIQVVEFV
ncbi:MAG: hypothetical protein LAT81_09900 [Oceanicaulis sp.]|nr:hypothetical protein [Oceanicaulis sp.]